MNRRIDPPTKDDLHKILLEQQAILDNATVGILFSRNRIIVACNTLGGEMFGYSEQDMIGLPGITLYPSESSYTLLARKAGPILAMGQPFHDEIQYRRKDGSTFWARTSAKAIDPQSPRNGTIWILADVTEERAVRERLTQTTHELEAVFETSFIGIAVLREGRIERCNRRYAELLGYSTDEIIGQSGRLFYQNDAEFDQAQATFRKDRKSVV